MTQIEENGHPFAGTPIIYSYTREQAMTDGELIDVTERAREAGFRYPVAVSRAVFGDIVDPPERAIAGGESVEGRLWDVLYMCASAARRIQSNHETDSVYFEVLATDQDGTKKLHQLWSKCGPGDTAAPVVTIMMQGED